MEILLLDLQPRPGLSFTETLASALGTEVCVACPGESELARRLESRGIPVFALPEGKPWGFSILTALRRVIREENVRLVHTLEHRAALSIALLLRKCNLPWVHAVRAENSNLLKCWRYRRVNKLVFNSTCECNQTHIPAGIQAECSVCLPGFDQLNLMPHRQRHDGRFVFLAASPFTKQGGVDFLLQAMAYLKNMAIELPPWEVRVAGEGPLLGELLVEAEKLGVEGQLCLLGKQSPRLLYPDADAVVSPLTSGSGAITGIAEAWAAALPVVCTALPNHEEIVQDKTSALLVPPSNPVALAGAMLRLLQEEDLRERLVQGGREAVEKFTPAFLAVRYRALYEHLSGGAPPPLSPEDV